MLGTAELVEEVTTGDSKVVKVTVYLTLPYLSACLFVICCYGNLPIQLCLLYVNTDVRRKITLTPPDSYRLLQFWNSSHTGQSLEMLAQNVAENFYL